MNDNQNLAQIYQIINYFTCSQSITIYTYKFK
jgi:hypothetical protein